MARMLTAAEPTGKYPWLEVAPDLVIELAIELAMGLGSKSWRLTRMGSSLI